MLDQHHLDKKYGFKEIAYVKNYFGLKEPVYCPICSGDCLCDGIIIEKQGDVRDEKIKRIK